MARHRPPDMGHRAGSPAHGANRSNRASPSPSPTRLRAAVYTRKSSEEGLEQDFNSLHAQREACEAYVTSQRHEGWVLIDTPYGDGGFSGGSMDRPALKRLLADIDLGLIDIVVVYKVDRLTRSLADFAKMIEIFDNSVDPKDSRRRHPTSFVSVTQSFNTTSSMGRLTLNVLLSFAQFEREVTGERIRDKIAASKKKGLWMGGAVPMGYRPAGRTLAIHDPDADTVRGLFKGYLRLGNVTRLADELAAAGLRTPLVTASTGRTHGGRPFSRGHLYAILSNPIYIGEIIHKGVRHAGQHPAIIDSATWQQVQTRLGDNCFDRRAGTDVNNPSLLLGLLHDADGNRLTASHATKGDRRYRYYQHPAALAIKASSRIRMPAGELETLVISQTVGLLTHPAELTRTFATPNATPDDLTDLIRIAAQRAEQLRYADGSTRRSALLATIAHVTVRADGISIHLRADALRPTTDDFALPRSTHPDTHDSAYIMMAPGQLAALPFPIEVPARLVLARGQTSLVIHGEPVIPRPRADQALIRAIARAVTWAEHLTSGRCTSIADIARSEQVTDKYIHQLLPLAFLDPDLVTDLINGRVQSRLTITDVAKGAAIPTLWVRQAEELVERSTRRPISGFDQGH